MNFIALHTKTLSSKEESSAVGFKLNKQGVTVLTCSNSCGNKQVTVNGHWKVFHAKRIFKLNTNFPPVYYRNQNKHWITGNLFKEWFDKKFVPSVIRFIEENRLPH